MAGTLRLLVAEDSDDDVFFLKRAIEKSRVPFDTRFVKDGQEAIDYLEGQGRFSDRQSYPLPMMMMMDLKMPGLNGFDLLQWVKQHQHFRQVPVIILSSSNDQDDVSRAYRLGASGYLTKPHISEDLGNLLKGMDGYWRAYNQFPRLDN